AHLYGADDQVLGGLNSFYLLLEKPEVYGLPSDPKLPSRSVLASTFWSVFTGLLVALGILFQFRQRTAAARDPGAPPRPSSWPVPTGAGGSSPSSSWAASPRARTSSPSSSNGSAPTRTCRWPVWLTGSPFPWSSCAGCSWSWTCTVPSASGTCCSSRK